MNILEIEIGNKKHLREGIFGNNYAIIKEYGAV